jgi:prolyl 4-hydroxylase
MADHELPTGPLYAETVILTTLRPGGSHPRHADNCVRDEFDNWRPNHTPHRNLSAICYLNSDFEGGEIVFESQNLVIRPTRGLLLVFPSDQHHIHEVRPVKNGVRYTLAIWFTRNETFAQSEFRSMALSGLQRQGHVVASS